MSRRVARVLIASTAFIYAAITWSYTDNAAIHAQEVRCHCAGAVQVQIDGSYVGGQEFAEHVIAFSTVDCAANKCQGFASQTADQLCATYNADTYTDQWWWAYDNPVGSGYVEQSGNCP